MGTNLETKAGYPCHHIRLLVCCTVVYGCVLTSDCTRGKRYNAPHIFKGSRSILLSLPVSQVQGVGRARPAIDDVVCLCKPGSVKYERVRPEVSLPVEITSSLSPYACSQPCFDSSRHRIAHKHYDASLCGGHGALFP